MLKTDANLLGKNTERKMTGKFNKNRDVRADEGSLKG